MRAKIIIKKKIRESYQILSIYDKEKSQIDKLSICVGQFDPLLESYVKIRPQIFSATHFFIQHFCVTRPNNRLNVNTGEIPGKDFRTV
jgi:hypothetical protein